MISIIFSCFFEAKQGTALQIKINHNSIRKAWLGCLILMCHESINSTKESALPAVILESNQKLHYCIMNN